MLSLKADMSSVSIYPPTLFRGAQIGRNAKFLDTLHSSKKATKDRILVAIVLCIKQLVSQRYLHALG